jgi:uncharacterized coiled-coil DUF342 family protein
MKREKVVSEQQKTREIEELTQKLSALKEQKDKLDIEANIWAEKRNKLNEQSKRLRAEILNFRNERDKLNEKVKELKQQREKAKTEIHEKIEEIKQLNQQIKALTKKKPSKSHQTLQKEVESIDWKIQTTPLNLKEEKELVEKVKQLETQLNIHRKLEQSSHKILELQTGIKTLKTKSRLCHENLTEMAQESQEIHGKMLEKIEELKKIETEADSFHKLFVQTKERTKPLQENTLEISKKLKQMRDEIREEAEKEKKKSEEALREKLEKQAREKMRRGEKLTWEEFQLLAEKGITTQD